MLDQTEMSERAYRALSDRVLWQNRMIAPRFQRKHIQECEEALIDELLASRLVRLVASKTEGNSC